jgi:SNF2 family DNA or RNA helicase
VVRQLCLTTNTVQVLPGKFNILVTTYEFIMRDRSKLCRVDWKYMVIDEAQVRIVRFNRGQAEDVSTHINENSIPQGLKLHLLMF